jgi:hypothetical protein
MIGPKEDSMKSRVIAVVGSLGFLCALCCSLPILALVGLGSIEALFCDNAFLKWSGIALASGAAGYFVWKAGRRFGAGNASCSVACSCKPA